MFQVRTTSPLDEDWELLDDLLYKAAGRKSDQSGAGKTEKGKYREHVWLVCDFKDAQALKLILETLDGVSASIREHTSLSGV